MFGKELTKKFESWEVARQSKSWKMTARFFRIPFFHLDRSVRKDGIISQLFSSYQILLNKVLNWALFMKQNLSSWLSCTFHNYLLFWVAFKVLFTYEYTWQNFHLGLLRLVNNCLLSPWGQFWERVFPQAQVHTEFIARVPKQKNHQIVCLLWGNDTLSRKAFFTMVTLLMSLLGNA